MPGQGSYGPAGKWIHERAHRIMEESGTPKSIAYPVAVQQAHKVGKSPKKFRTSQGVREAKAKMVLPKKFYQKTAEARLAGFFDELEKDASLTGKALKFLAGYLIAKKVFGLGQSGEKKMTEGELRAMRLGMQMGARTSAPAATGGITREMQSEIAPFESQMSRIEADLRKTAAMGVDLRLKGPGGVQRPPFPTEGSKSLAFKNFQQSRKIGQSTAVKPPEPNIRSVTSLPG